MIALLAALFFVEYHGAITAETPLTSQRDAVVHVQGWTDDTCFPTEGQWSILSGNTIRIRTTGHYEPLNHICWPGATGFNYSVHLGSLPAGTYDITSDLPGVDSLHVAVPDSEFPDPRLFARFLLPPLFDSNGAFGAHWVTDAVVFNNGTRAGLFTKIGTLDAIPQRTTDLAAALGPHPAGLFLFVPRDAIGAMQFNTTVREASRDGGTFGATIPVAREENFRGSLDILNVPYDPRYRLQLRVYGDFTGETFARRAAVSVITNDDRFVGETDVELLTPPGDFGTPPSATIDLGPMLAKLSAGTRVRVNLGTSPARVWGFITLTNNDTQHVTVYAPD